MLEIKIEKAFKKDIARDKKSVGGTGERNLTIAFTCPLMFCPYVAILKGIVQLPSPVPLCSVA